MHNIALLSASAERTKADLAGCHIPNQAAYGPLKKHLEGMGTLLARSCWVECWMPHTVDTEDALKAGAGTLL